MKRYIKVNGKKEIIDLFFECWKDRLDGTEIYFDDKDFPDGTIDGKYISNDIGVPIFFYDKGKITEKKQTDIDKDLRTGAKKAEQAAQDLELKIQAELRQMAIASLTAKGDR